MPCTEAAASPARPPMISQTTEYALRAIVFLGVDPGGAKTTAEISQGIRAPVAYLSKIMMGLARAHLVASQRGLHGGFMLARDPSDMTIYDVVQAVDPILRISSCPLDVSGHGKALCLLHATLDQAMGQTETLFRATRISDLLRGTEGLGGLQDDCRFPKDPCLSG